ncbi:hypothetical protein CsSME_00046643 [Camellia sinensis var. sinensis]
MQSLTPSTSISLKSLITTKSPISTNRVGPSRLLVKCVYRFDSANATSNAATTNANVLCGGVGSCRADWQSSCAILASKVASQQQDTEKSGNSDITAVNGHKTLLSLSIFI